MKTLIKISILSVLLALLPEITLAQKLVSSENYTNGNIKKAVYSDGTIVLIENYYESGKIRDRAEYLGTQKNGNFQSWYENGEKQVSAVFSAGVPDGNWTAWNDQGDLIGSAVYDKGTILKGSMLDGNGKMVAYK